MMRKFVSFSLSNFRSLLCCEFSQPVNYFIFSWTPIPKLLHILPPRLLSQILWGTFGRWFSHFVSYFASLCGLIHLSWLFHLSLDYYTFRLWCNSEQYNIFDWYTVELYWVNACLYCFKYLLAGFVFVSISNFNLSISHPCWKYLLFSRSPLNCY